MLTFPAVDGDVAPFDENPLGLNVILHIHERLSHARHPDLEPGVRRHPELRPAGGDAVARKQTAVLLPMTSLPEERVQFRSRDVYLPERWSRVILRHQGKDACVGVLPRCPDPDGPRSRDAVGLEVMSGYAVCN